MVKRWNERELDLEQEQCDQIGWFLKDLGNQFCLKIAQLFDDFLGYFEQWNFSI